MQLINLAATKKERNKIMNEQKILTETMEALFDVDTEASETYMVYGYFMAWDGKKEGTKFITTKNIFRGVILDMLLEETGFESVDFFADEEGRLVIEEYHHDSPVVPNHYVVCRLTKKGKKELDESTMSRRELVNYILEHKDMWTSVVPDDLRPKNKRRK